MSTVSDIFSEIVSHLVQAGMSRDEAVVYTELTKAPSTHLKLSRTTGISRTKVYRITAKLEKLGIIIRRSDDRGKFLVAGDLEPLNEEVKRQQLAAETRRKALEKAVQAAPLLALDAENDFVVHTYTGIEGMRQMQWHELKAKKDLLALGYITYEELAGSHQWAEAFRARVAAAGYRTRELIGRMPPSFEVHFTQVTGYAERYAARRLVADDLPVHAPMVIYNNTVAIYQVDTERPFGVEIIHPGFAKTMACIFEQYWSRAEDVELADLRTKTKA